MGVPIGLSAGFASVVAKGGTSVRVCDKSITSGGGWVINPLVAKDQAIHAAENLYVDFTGPADLAETDTTIALKPGQTLMIPPFSSVWVNAAANGHAFAGVFVNIPVQFPPTPVPGVFPPEGPTGLTETIKSYLYQQYFDDDDLQAFVDAYNAISQDYVDTFNALKLPIYTNELIAGPLADWVMTGLYGYPRPTLYTTREAPIGPLNTWWPNYTLYGGIGPNMIAYTGPQNVLIADDDLYKRCLTWHYMKGDGKYFNVRWLKRRVWRFLIGLNGTSPHIDNTDQVSITFGPNYEVTIRIVLMVRTVIGGMMPNMFGPNGLAVIQNAAVTVKATSVMPLNTILSTLETLPQAPKAQDLLEAVQTGVLELPFQFKFDVQIG
jgi:hypothetical protein